MRDPVSGREYPEAIIKTAAEIKGISYDALIEEIKRGRVVLLEDGKMLKRGYTTGTCATAASKAAALLYAGKEAKKVEVTTSAGIKVEMAIENEDAEESIACVRVDSGDYKGDTFSGLLICARARQFPVFAIRAGKGIGIIKKAGLGKVGAPDIYPHILMDIETNVKEVIAGGVEIEIFVPEGEKIAKDTVLPMLGIEGGIPIFGATGFIEPYTEDGYKHVIDALIRDKTELIGVSTGEKSKRIAVEKLNFPVDNIVVAGNYVCYAIEKSKAKKKVIFAMPAKICDLLEIDAHDHFDLEFSTVAELVERLKVADYERLKSFFHALAEDLARKNSADVYVFDNSGDTVGSFIRCP
ncbi:Cobalt-precorrin-5B C(1)-methyltransferase [ANME-1 cluster archaeon GoMg3.2]|nr:Cobalt-precorrin-5B C(1)-methyltransferase [ANME-1 cluster archaeon GoMg3.2]